MKIYMKSNGTIDSDKTTISSLAELIGLGYQFKRRNSEIAIYKPLVVMK